MGATANYQGVFTDCDNNDSFQRDGYIVIEELLPDQLLTPFDLLFKTNAYLYDVPFYAGTMGFRENHKHRYEINHLFRETMAPVAKSLLLNYLHYYGGFGIKHPTGKRSILNLHQDITTVPYDCFRTSVTLWMPLCDVDESNGCIALFPGSHKLNRSPRAPGAPFVFAERKDEIVREHLIPIPMRRGSLLVMDQAIMHQSGPNVSNSPRVVVMGMLRPEELPVVYYHRVLASLGWNLELYEVPDDYYVCNQIGRRPTIGKLIEIIKEALPEAPVKF